MKNTLDFDLLLSLPPNMCGVLSDCEPRVAQRAFATFDPPEQQLGSGGGTAYVLEQAWRASGVSSFQEWLSDSGKLILHGGGESRRLPPYAPQGKLFIPLPVFRWALGQRLDQTLLDLAEPTLQKLAQAAPDSARVMVASGDVLVRLENEELPNIPEADVVLFGLWTTPEVAQNFGVMFCDRDHPQELLTFLQKPSPDTIRKKSREYAFLVDAGIWLLSQRAVDCLMQKSGWDSSKEKFNQEVPDQYDLYGDWALRLGTDAQEKDPQVSELSVAVVPISDAGFYHFGTCPDMLDSLYELQNLVVDQTRLGTVGSLAQPRQFVQNAHFMAPLRREENHSLWVENSYIPASWKIACRNVLTGVPKNDWTIELEEGVCIDFVPVPDGNALRVYGFDDPFRGAVSDPQTRWMGRSFLEWLKRRDISLEEAGIDPQVDLQQAPLHPVLSEFSGAFVQWMFAHSPENSVVFKSLWLNATRLSSRQLAHQALLKQTYASREELRQKALSLMAQNAHYSVFYKLDLEATARLYAQSNEPLPSPLPSSNQRHPLMPVHNRMFRATVQRLRGVENWQEAERETFTILRDLIVDPYKAASVHPRHTLLADQIVWGRSPVRLDLAGGWSDTPPFCLEHGGTVLNLAVELNGQPPIQVFARRTPEFNLTIRSIDLGLKESLETYEDVRAYDQLGSGFTLARAAFALTGFHPDFNGAAFSSLSEQLKAMGGGVEISMLAAVPKGSGLGTSSILAATLLGVLSDFSGLGWDRVEIACRTLALEQMLTSGGGWQDQVGGIFPGIKCVQTRPGLTQYPVVRWLPNHFFQGTGKARMLLYYTGLTRVAHNILGEIVRGIFLNAADRLKTIQEIARNASACHDAIQLNDFDSFAQSIQKSWQLNQQLDAGTNTPEVEQILQDAAEDLAAAKLLGAGGGGYLFMLAKTADAALRIQERLEANPPNEGARFVDFSISTTGLQVTRS